MTEDELDRALLGLRAEYVEQLPGMVGEMEDLWRRLVAAETPSLRLAELARMAHSIAGSGTTFGVPAASQAGRDLELFLEAFRERDHLPGPAEQEAIAALLAALRQAATQS